MHFELEERKQQGGFPTQNQLFIIVSVQYSFLLNNQISMIKQPTATSNCYSNNNNTCILQPSDESHYLRAANLMSSALYTLMKYS